MSSVSCLLSDVSCLMSLVLCPLSLVYLSRIWIFHLQLPGKCQARPLSLYLYLSLSLSLSVSFSVLFSNWCVSVCVCPLWTLPWTGANDNRQVKRTYLPPPLTDTLQIHIHIEAERQMSSASLLVIVCQCHAMRGGRARLSLSPSLSLTVCQPAKCTRTTTSVHNCSIPKAVRSCAPSQ